MKEKSVILANQILEGKRDLERVQKNGDQLQEQVCQVQRKNATLVSENTALVQKTISLGQQNTNLGIRLTELQIKFSTLSDSQFDSQFNSQSNSQFNSQSSSQSSRQSTNQSKSQPKKRVKQATNLMSKEEEIERLTWRIANVTSKGKIKCYCGGELVWRTAKVHWKNYQEYGRCTLKRQRAVLPNSEDTSVEGSDEDTLSI